MKLCFKLLCFYGQRSVQPTKYGDCEVIINSFFMDSNVLWHWNGRKSMLYSTSIKFQLSEHKISICCRL